MENTIYWNGKPSDLENIFDVLEKFKGVQWYSATSEMVGRPLDTILSEWQNKHSTYYYIDNVKHVFELRNS